MSQRSLPSLSPLPSDSSLSRGKHRSSMDERIRQKADGELYKKSGREGIKRKLLSREEPGTVGSLKPSPPISISMDATVTEASLTMAAKRVDSLLIMDKFDELRGIVTDKDIAFKVVAENLDAGTVRVNEIMTKSVQCVYTSQQANEALSLMINGGFRHLPVLSEEGDVIGVLDITKCLYEALLRLDKLLGSSRKVHDALEAVQREFGTSGLAQQFEQIREKLLVPDVHSILEPESLVEATTKTTVLDAVKIMKKQKSTAILVFDESKKLNGIFTTKDLVLRVIASKNQPRNTSVIRAMTPKPDTVSLETTIYDALKIMQERKFLHLPVVDSRQKAIGLIDVMTLTLSVLNRINQVSEPNNIWQQEFEIEESVCSVEEGFMFKFLNPKTKRHVCIHSPPQFSQIIQQIKERTTLKNIKLSYLDDDGDEINILNDDDVVSAVRCCREHGQRRLNLIVKTPSFVVPIICVTVFCFLCYKLLRK